MTDCIFCKIIRKEIPNYTIYEDNDVLAFLDIHPTAKGHTVVIPKIHCETVFDCDEQLLASLMLGVEKTMKAVADALQPDGFNAGWNHAKAGGQAVPHLHVHVIPRWEGDGGGSMHSIVRNAGDMSVEEVAKNYEV